MQSLRTDTIEEARGTWNDNPDKIARLDETRNVTVQIAKSLGVEFNPLAAINMGLNDLLPDGQLEQWATMEAYMRLINHY
jgi:hypothetical protein